MTTNRMGLTDDNLRDLSSFLLDSYTGSLDTLRYAYAAEAIGELLAYREVSKEPAAFTGSGSIASIKAGKEGFIWGSKADAHPIPLYTAPPLQAVTVPDELKVFEAAIDACRRDDGITEHAWNHGVLAVMHHFSACRAAMLEAPQMNHKN